MDLARRMKYSGHNHKVLKSDRPKVRINFDLNVLNLFSSYIISTNTNIRRSHIINMRNLFEIIDLEVYKSDIEKMKRINFIRKGIEARLLKNLTEPTLIVSYINGGIIDDNIIDINNFSILSSEELDWINGTVSEALKYAFIDNDIDRLLDVCTRYKASDFLSRGSIVQEIEAIITEMMTKFRRVRVETQAEMMFTLKNGIMEEVVTDIHQQLSRPSNRLITGMQGVNELSGGGFESGRGYLFLGNTGSRKSITLLNIGIQIKKYNRNFIPKDPTKIPVVVILTMENSVKETVQRMFEIIAGNELINYSPEEVINILRTEGELYLRDDSPIDIIIKYVPDRSVDTGYLYTLTEDLEDEGYEVICMIQDHIKRIRSCYSYPDIRLELGAVVNEFKTFATIKDIPIITNSHLNRDGAKSIDEGLKGNKFDLIRQLGRANVGESMLMLDNIDCAYLIGPEYDVNGNLYMGFKRIKSRVKVTLRDYICQPFANPDSIKLVEDFYSAVPVFRESLKPTPQESTLYNTGINSNSNRSYNNIKDLDEVFNKEDMEDQNIFHSKSRYNQSTTVYLDEEEELPTQVVGIKSQPLMYNPIIFRNIA